MKPVSRKNEDLSSRKKPLNVMRRYVLSRNKYRIKDIESSPPPNLGESFYFNTFGRHGGVCMVLGTTNAATYDTLVAVNHVLIQVKERSGRDGWVAEMIPGTH